MHFKNNCKILICELKNQKQTPNFQIDFRIIESIPWIICGLRNWAIVDVEMTFKRDGSIVLTDVTFIWIRFVRKMNITKPCFDSRLLFR